jgi:hypothetical protein
MINTNIIDKKYIMLCGLIIFFISRIVYLDSNIPFWHLTQYAPIDEFFYVINSLNFYSSVSLENINELRHVDIIVGNIMQELATYFTLILFGDNYYGLRMSSVLASFLIITFLFFSIKKIYISEKNENKISKVWFWCIAYLVTDFSFLLASRVVEPTIYRMLILTFIIFISTLPSFNRGFLSKLQVSLLGFLAAFSVLYVYIYNFFILPAVFVSVVIYAKRQNWQNAFSNALYFMLGSILCLISCEVFANVVFHKSLITFWSLLTSPQVSAPRVSLFVGLRDELIRLTNIFSTNLFRFNISFLFLFLAALPVVVKRAFIEKKLHTIVLVNLIIFLFLQSLVVNDYYYRKLVIFLPLVIITLASFYPNTLLNKNISKVYLAYLVICISFSLYILKIAVYNSGAYSLSGMHPIINLITFFLLLVYFISKYLFKIKDTRFVKVSILIAVLLPNLYLDVKYIYSNPSFKYRDTMIEMSHYVDDKVVVGGWSYAFCLYNKSVPVINPYRYNDSKEMKSRYDYVISELFEKGIAKYSIAYTDKKTLDSMERQGLYLIKEFKYHEGDPAYPYVGIYAPK